MAQRKKTKKKLTGKKRIFVKLYDNYAVVCIAMADLHNSFGGIWHHSRDNYTMKQWNILAVGKVYWAGAYSTYYGTDTKVRSDYMGQGHGDLLYKAMLLAADFLAKKANKRKTIFSPHEAIGSSTSYAAWRCYRALARKGYLKPIGKSKKKMKDFKVSDKYEIKRLPKCMKPIFLQGIPKAA